MEIIIILLNTTKIKIEIKKRKTRIQAHKELPSLPKAHLIYKIGDSHLSKKE